jgi:hypothetical protein
MLKWMIQNSNKKRCREIALESSPGDILYYIFFTIRVRLQIMSLGNMIIIYLYRYIII